MLKLIRSAFLGVGILATSAIALALADYAITQGSGTTIFSFTCFTTKACPSSTPVNSAGTEIGTVASPLYTASPGADPCQGNAKTFTPISVTTATTTRIVAPVSAKRTYICALFLTSVAADNIGIVEGTGGTCGSGTAGVIGGTTAANGPNFPANGGFAWGQGNGTVAATAGTNVDLCLITSAATPLAGHIAWVQAP